MCKYVHIYSRIYASGIQALENELGQESLER
jgi:hypothetical protein